MCDTRNAEENNNQEFNSITETRQNDWELLDPDPCTFDIKSTVYYQTNNVERTPDVQKEKNMVSPRRNRKFDNLPADATDKAFSDLEVNFLEMLGFETEDQLTSFFQSQDLKNKVVVVNGETLSNRRLLYVSKAIRKQKWCISLKFLYEAGKLNSNNQGKFKDFFDKKKESIQDADSKKDFKDALDRLKQLSESWKERGMLNSEEEPQYIDALGDLFHELDKYYYAVMLAQNETANIGTLANEPLDETEENSDTLGTLAKESPTIDFDIDSSSADDCNEIVDMEASIERVIRGLMPDWSITEFIKCEKVNIFPVFPLVENSDIFDTCQRLYTYEYFEPNWKPVGTQPSTAPATDVDSTELEEDYTIPSCSLKRVINQQHLIKLLQADAVVFVNYKEDVADYKENHDYEEDGKKNYYRNAADYMRLSKEIIDETLASDKPQYNLVSDCYVPAKYEELFFPFPFQKDLETYYSEHLKAVKADEWIKTCMKVISSITWEDVLFAQAKELSKSVPEFRFIDLVPDDYVKAFHTKSKHALVDAICKKLQQQIERETRWSFHRATPSYESVVITHALQR